MKEWIVSADESGMRLLPFLKNKLGDAVSARHLKRAMDAGRCQLNGKSERFGATLVGKGDRINFHDLKERSLSLVEGAGPRFIYLDEFLVIYDKPAGIASTDVGLLAAVQKRLPEAQLIHRLDRDTTGALVFAKMPEVGEAMVSLFKKRKVQKTYLALVDGIPSRSAGVVQNYLGKLSEYHGQAIWGSVAKERGLVACTRWEVEKTGREASVLLCYPETGRTHQIRVHLSGLGHPILGDYQYGRTFHCPYRPERILLHAYALAFEHPITKETIDVSAPPPQDFQSAVKTLIGKL